MLRWSPGVFKRERVSGLGWGSYREGRGGEPRASIVTVTPMFLPGVLYLR